MSLSAALFEEVRPDFFRVLSGASAPLFVDVLQALDRAITGTPEGISREDAIGVAEEVIERHPAMPVQEDEDAEQGLTARDRARVVIDRLAGTGWLEEQETAAWRRTLTMEGNGALMVKTLRQMAWPEAAVFSDKLSSVCSMLGNPAMMEDQPWAAVESSISHAEEGLAELRSMGRSIQRHTKRQLAANSLKENLAGVFDRFAERIGRACYAELVRARLHTRLGTARRQLDALPSEERIMEKMRGEVLRREPSLSREEAMGRVMEHLDQLSVLLGAVSPLVERVDQRTAEFARRSLARFRYLQESGSERRAKVQEFFETLNLRFAGMRVAEAGDISGLPLPVLRLHDVQFFGGFDSLSRPRRTLTTAALESVPEEAGAGAEAGLAEFAQHWRSSLTVARANRFVNSLPGPPGTRIPARDLPLDDEEGMADLISCILHRRSRTAAYRLEIDRQETDADEPQWDRIGAHEIESFTLVKK